MEFEELKIEIPIEEGEEDDSYELQLPPKKYENKAGGFVVGFDVNSKEAQEKRARRQKRFGFIEEEKEEKGKTTEEEEREEICYDLPKDIPKIPQADVRLDALFVYGIQDLHTKDVFDYFQDYGPGSIEWIDDYSCNVVWDDEHSAATTLDSMGKDISTELDTRGNNNLLWKAGPPCKKAGCKLLMRQSTKKDKKQAGAAKRSMYYLIHGHPENSRGKVGVKGLVSKSRKRKIMQEQERARHKSSGEPDVAFVDKIETEEEKMEVDEPALKVVVKNDRTTEEVFSDDISQRLQLRMHADNLQKGKIKDRLQERLQFDIENNIKKSSGDLRERLKSRRKHGFDFIDKPSLSIEIREEQT